ncbi:hypothetical protein [Streptomyces hirsutus]|uniref:hypothetical protein n=1 Tax=Streptomyces hirsutus TaxID=35620 RepID=UPI00331DCA24
MALSRFQYRDVTASRNLATGPDAVSRNTGCVATLPTAQIIVSFIVPASPARTPAPATGRIRVRARPVRLRVRLPPSDRAR